MKYAKKRIVTACLGVALAVATVVGGSTFAYLQSESEDIVNEFKTNQVSVSLSETSGSSYQIIPGTTQTKNPTVTLNNTVDAYVYVYVDDNTDNLVDYDIADGWQLLDGYDSVYYREVLKDDETKSFSVLQDDKVSYDSSLTNEDMLDAADALKQGLTLTFTAYASQKAPFNDPVAACPLTSASDLAGAIEQAEPGDVLYVAGEVSEPLDIDKSVTINNLKATAPVTVSADGVVLNKAEISADEPSTPAVTVPSTVTDFTMTDSVIEADTGSEGTHTAVNIAAGGDIVFTGNTVTNYTYNGIELSQSKAVGSVTISGNHFVNCGNNAISIYLVEEGAEITIEKNEFINVSNAVRLSNYSGASATFNIYDNVANTDNMWNKVFVLLQGVSDRSNDFTKYTINFRGNTMDEGGVYTYVYAADTEPVVNILD